MEFNADPHNKSRVLSIRPLLEAVSGRSSDFRYQNRFSLFRGRMRRLRVGGGWGEEEQEKEEDAVYLYCRKSWLYNYIIVNWASTYGSTISDALRWKTIWVSGSYKTTLEQLNGVQLSDRETDCLLDSIQMMKLLQSGLWQMESGEFHCVCCAAFCSIISVCWIFPFRFLPLSISVGCKVLKNNDWY